MKFEAFFAAVAVTVASLPLRSSFALENGASRVSVDYVAPTPDCVSNDAFQALVKAEIARFPTSERDRRLSVRIVQQDGVYAGTLTTDAGASRTITAARCDDVTAALAVIIGVAEEPGAAPANAPTPPANKPAHVDLSQPSEPDREPSKHTPGLDLRVGARGFGWQRPSGSPSVGALGAISVELPWGFRKMMFEIGGGVSSTIGGSPVDTTYYIVDTQACLLDLPIESTGLSVLGCLRLDGAQFRADGVGGPVLIPDGMGGEVLATPTKTGGAFWTGVSARVRWQSPVSVFVEGNVDGMYGTVSAGESNVPVWIAIGLGVGLQI